MEQTTKAVTGVEVLGAPEKVPARSGGKRTEWRVPVRYTLDDGSTIDTGDRFGTRRDALAEAGQWVGYHATFHDGVHSGWRMTIRIGGAS